MMMVTSRRLLTCVVVFALATSACGDDDGATESATEAPPATEAPVATEPAAAPTTAAPSENGNGNGGDLDLGELFTGRCEEAALGVAAAMSAYSTGLAQAFSGVLDEDELEASADELRQFADDAPDELKDDLEVMAVALAEFVQAFIDSGYDPTSGETPTLEQLEQLSQLAEQFDDSRFEEAAANIEAWFEDNCN
jgi:hypothetical protein